MQGIYNYIPETNHVSRTQSVQVIFVVVVAAAADYTFNFLQSAVT